MGHGLGSDIGSDLSSAPPSPRLPPSPSPPPAPRLAPRLPPLSPPQPTRDRSLSSATEPPWKARPRPKRQPSTSIPNPPSSPKRRKRTESGKEKNTEKGKDTEKQKDAEKGKEPAGKGKGTGSTRGKGAAKAVGKIQVPVKAKDPPPEEEEPTVEKASTSKVAPAPWKKVKISPPPAPVPATKPPPFAKAKITSKPPFNTSKSASPDPSKAIKPAPSSAVKPTRTTKRPVYNESADSSDEEEEQEKPKRHKRRKSHVEATPRASRKPRPSLPAQPTPKAKPKPDPSPLELRPASFLTKTSSFLTKAIVPPTNLSLQPREDVWSYDDLTGLAWVKLDVHKCEVVPRNGQAGVLGEQWCWWPAEVKQNTSNGIKLGLCGIGIERELTPHSADETNVLTLRKPNCSSVRFPTFKTAFSAPSKDFESPPRFGEPPTGETSSQPSGEPSSESATQPAGKASTPPNEPSILPTSPSALETTWKQALACAFKIDADSNDGLEDIFLLFSQKSNLREEDEMSGNTALDEHDEEELEEDVLENGTTVLCRYRTRYYPAQIISYHPKEGKAKSRRGHKGRYKCVFADESTRLATRVEIMTTLDEGFATCPLGTYQRYTSGAHEKPSGVREPSPAPRAHSPTPEHEDCKIDPEEYCSRERMRDQLKPVLPFLKGLIERTYIPGKGVVEGGHSTEPKVDDPPPIQEHDASEPEPILDRHAIFMQGGRARKNLAYSVHTGDLNEDDCEELMFEISRWALRGERWACEEGAGQEYGGEVASQQSNEGVGGASQESGEGEGASQEVQEGGRSQTDLETEVTGDSSSLQPAQESEPIVEGAKTLDNAEDVEMEDASQEAHESGVSEAKSGDTTELEEDALMVVKILEPTTPSTYGDFRSLIKLQPPRPTGAPDYEGLTPEERMGYVSDVLYPEAAALILSYRRGIRTQPGPLSDPTAERALYTAGQQAAKNTSSTSDWVEQILAIRQLRAANSKYHVEEQAQVVVAGGTKSRPKYMTSVSK